jgi:hypothetical protein
MKRHDSRCAFPLPDLVPLLVAAPHFLLAGFVEGVVGLGALTASAWLTDAWRAETAAATQP